MFDDRNVYFGREQSTLDGNFECKKCRSKYLLTRAHLCTKHNHEEHTGKCAKIILCETCHYYQDYDKNFNCYFGAQMKIYLRKMDKYFGEFK